MEKSVFLGKLIIFSLLTIILVKVSHSEEINKKIFEESVKNVNLVEEDIKISEELNKSMFDYEMESEGEKKSNFFNIFGIYPYKENYFLFWTYDTDDKPDRKNSEAKFQLSLMKPLFHNLLGLNEIYAFAYTQQSYWQIFADSSPFRETNYEPEFFILFPIRNEHGLKGFRLSFNHQSNGQGEPKSKSWNRIIGEVLLKIGTVKISLQAWYRIPEKKEDDDNPDILHYVGNGQLEVYIPIKEHLVKFRVRDNLKTKNNRGLLEVGWSFPVPMFRKTYIYIQYVNGYGESLIDYKRRVQRIGVGVMLTR